MFHPRLKKINNILKPICTLFRASSGPAVWLNTRVMKVIMAVRGHTYHALSTYRSKGARISGVRVTLKPHILRLYTNVDQ